MFTSAADRVVQRPMRAAALAVALVTLVLCTLVSTSTWAQQEPSPTVEAPGAQQGLAAELGSSFEVLPTRSGLLLRPLVAGSGVRTVEISPGEVAIDGVVVDDQELSERLGASANAVRALAALSSEEARAVVGIGRPASPPPQQPAPEVAPETAPDAVEEPAEAAPRADSPPSPARPAPPHPPAPAPVRTHHVGERVSFASSVDIEEDEVAEVAVAIGGSVRVDGEVEQDAVAVGGDVRVDGRVEGNAVAVGGSVYLGEESVVEGDVSSVGGEVLRQDGSHIGGSVSEVSMASGILAPGFWRGERHRDPSSRFRRSLRGRAAAVGEVVGAIVGLILLTLLVWLVTVVARAPVERVAAKVEHDTMRCLIAGFLLEVLFIPVLAAVVIVLAISVLGIPLLVLVPFVLLLLAFGLLLGFAGVARRVGRYLEHRLGWNLQGTFLLVLVGVTAIQIWTIFARGLDAIGGPMSIFAAILWVFGLVLEFLAWTIGLGAVMLTRFGAGPRPVESAAAPLPPAPIADEPFAATEPVEPAQDAAERVADVEPPAPAAAEAPGPFWEQDEDPAAEGKALAEEMKDAESVAEEAAPSTAEEAISELDGEPASEVEAADAEAPEAEEAEPEDSEAEEPDAEDSEDGDPEGDDRP